MVVTLDPMHDEEITRMSTLAFTSQLTKLEKPPGDRTRNGVTLTWSILMKRPALLGAANVLIVRGVLGH